MEVLECEFNPVKDIREVDQFGYVDLCQAFVTGTIAADLKVEEKSFNEIDDPQAVNGRPGNVFEMIDAGVGIAHQGQVTSQPSSLEDGGD